MFANWARKLFDFNSWTFAKALGKSGGFNEKRVSDIEPFSPQINIRRALHLIVLFVSFVITLSFSNVIIVLFNSKVHFFVLHYTIQ